eukprot:snap_masked-scaffold_11-processed-gene-3.9-mRNA-1 protein AED:0.08 eAED:0.08 QI:0/-1/0/1/-1/1/1/0/379
MEEKDLITFPEEEAAAASEIQTAQNEPVKEDPKLVPIDNENPEKAEPIIPREPVNKNEGIQHRIKKLSFFNRTVSVCLQNENGPCPLLGIVNALVLRGAITINADYSQVSSTFLIDLVANYLLEVNQRTMNPTEESTKGIDDLHNKTLHDVIEILPTLQYGMDVNVKFSGIHSFEFNSLISIFDMLDLNLFHSWVISPEDPKFELIKDLSYNQLVDLIVSSKDETKVFLLQEFLNETQSQITKYGLDLMKEKDKGIKERELCVVFRNNHFTTLFKYEGELYLLLTDFGYENEIVCWENLTSIDGDNSLVKADFNVPNFDLAATEAPIPLHLDSDAALAQQLHQQELQEAEYARIQRENLQRVKETEKKKAKKKKGCVIT